MFYSQFILAKKGPLGTIWIAAHLERKLRKNQVTETNISLSVDSILFPEVPIALRLSGHLLLGVVRIYSRKVNYLFNDCSEALAKIKTAFHAGAVDLPPEAATAPFHSITLPETFDLDEFEPLLDRELDLLHSSAVDHHVSSREQITLQDPLEDNIYLGSQFGLDERFPEADAPRMGMDFDEDLLEKTIREASPVISTLQEDEEMPLEEEVIPVTRMDDEMDFDQMDRMDTMDMEDHHEPVTPALGLDDQMDLDYQNDGIENDRLERGPDELEQLEPDLDMDDLHAGVKDHLEPATPGTPQPEPEQEGKDELAEAQGEEERLEKPEEEVEVDKQDEEVRLDNGDEQARLESLDQEGGFEKQDEQGVLDVQAEQGTPEKQAEQGTLENQGEHDTLEKQDEEGTLEKQDEEGILEKQDEEALVERQEEAVKTETEVLEGGEGIQGEDQELEKQQEGEKLESLDAEVGADVHVEGETIEKQEGEENFEQEEGEEILEKRFQPEGENLENQVGSAEVDVTQDVNELNVNGDWTETQKLNDVPDFEIVMSAPDVVNRESDVFDLDIDMEKPVSPMGFQDKDQIMEDVDPLLQEEYIPGIGDEDPQAGMGNEMSPLRSPPFPDMGGDDMPGDDDVLASLLGRATPALKVMPTPPVKPVPKPRRKQRKRKVVMDMVTIIGADVMKQQLMNTDDIRRVRRKAPCTRRELWAVQQAEWGTQILHEPSMPGLCEELHSLFTRVYVQHMDEEESASPLREDIVAVEEIQEHEVPTVLEDLHTDVNEMAEPQGDYVLVEEEEMQFAADEQRQPDGHQVAEGVALDVAEDETALAQSDVPPEDLQNLASPSHPVEQEEGPVANYNGDEEALHGFEGEAKDGFTGLESPVVFEATTKDADLAIDVAEEKLQEEDAVQLDSVLVHEEVEAEAEAEAEGKAIQVETEVDEGQVLPEGEVMIMPVGEDIVTSEADVTAMPVVDVEGEDKAGIEIEAEVEAGNETTAEALIEIEASAEAEAVPSGQPGDEPLELYQEDGEGLKAGEETLEVVPFEGEVDVAIPSSPVEREGSPAALMDISHDAPMEVAAAATAVEADANAAAMAAMEAEADAAQAAIEAEAAMGAAPASPIDDSLDVPLIDLPAEEEPENEAFGFLGDTRDTEFLGADDDDLEEEADEFQDTNDYGRRESFMQDNSGWSSRTRAVGQYLRTSLEDLDAHMRRRQEEGIAKLSLDRMLIGKTKKEAARMFFETLVLKTKDYIHIEQNNPYGDIHISAGFRLPKAKF